MFLSLGVKLYVFHHPGGAQGWAGWGFEYSDVVGGVPLYSKGMELDGLKAPFQPKPFCDIPSVLWFLTWENPILIIGKTEHLFLLCRGGLAERLCRLQNRERSAISFWRHQCISDAKIPSGKKQHTHVKAHICM